MLQFWPKNLDCHLISKVLEVDFSNINLKATTTDGLGFIGEQEGIASMSICTVERGS